MSATSLHGAVPPVWAPWAPWAHRTPRGPGRPQGGASRGRAATLLALVGAVGCVLVTAPVARTVSSHPPSEASIVAKDAVARTDGVGAAGSRSQPVPASLRAAGYVSWPQAMAVQTRLDAVADRVSARAAGLDGYAGLAISVPDREVRVYWHGSLAAASRVQVESPALDDAPVRIVPADFTVPELTRARQAVVHGALGGGWTVVSQRPDGSGLSVSFGDPSARDAAVVRLLASPLTTTRSGRSVVVPVATELGDVQALEGSRYDDKAPFTGGALIHRPLDQAGTAAVCSTSFAGYKGHDLRILTAAHCGPVGSGWLAGQPPSSTRFGVIRERDVMRDVAFVKTFKRSEGYLDTLSAKVYSGVEIAADEHHVSVPVVRSESNHVGDWVTNLGAFSQATQAQVTGEGILRSGEDTWRAVSEDGYAVAAKGDSGGPVARVDTASHGEVYARGVVIVGSTTSPGVCHFSQANGCTTVFYFTDISQVEENDNFELITSESIQRRRAAQVPSWQIRPALSAANTCLEVLGGSRQNEARVTSGACNAGTNQRWNFQKTRLVGGEQYYRLVAAHSLQCLVTKWAAKSPGTALVQWPCAHRPSREATNAQWAFYGANVRPGTKTFQLRLYDTPNTCLVVPGQSGAGALLASCNGPAGFFAGKLTRNR